MLGLRLIAALFSQNCGACHLEFCSSFGLLRPCLWSVSRPHFNCTPCTIFAMMIMDRGEKVCKISARAWMTSLAIFELPFYAEVMLSNIYNLHLLQSWLGGHYISIMPYWRVARWKFLWIFVFPLIWSSLLIFRNNMYKQWTIPMYSDCLWISHPLFSAACIQVLQFKVK